MKIPETPPSIDELMPLLNGNGASRLPDILLRNNSPLDSKGRYLHWDDMRRRTPPDGLTHEEWWFGTLVARTSMSRPLPLCGVANQPFKFCNVDTIQEAVHRIDQQASGQILADDDLPNLTSSDRYLVSSLIEEAITSSQLEGAATTRQVAKAMLQEGRAPRDRSEQMILNNFQAMQHAESMSQSSDPLTPAAVLDLHRIITDGTLEDQRDAGRLQEEGEERIVVRWDEILLHQPPPAAELPDRLQSMCDFANGVGHEGFIHPVVRAIAVHFWLAYDHPFVDGNGRTARALFYWSMLRSGYWLTQYISISSILRKAPGKYAMSYLHVETDQNDMTYFINYQLSVIQRAIQSLREYLVRKTEETRQIESMLHGSSALNHRQMEVVSEALRDPSRSFTIRGQQTRHRVTYQSARTDMLGLETLGLFRKHKAGRQFVFRPEADLADRLLGVADFDQL